ncbi:hypothetical protein NP233_g1290 [Leucocoprinus birnbaumii]|uniref:Uncharacterized protein n=1 Tax=Leucocoprinus birnbaumii TaxID=56174 RepID=A0AAD5W0C2_9AGAR|nr:hypothetical protein NP233_g1290 [Leucocoprinus birnbaumii]
MAALVPRQLPDLLSGILNPFPHHTDTTESAGLPTKTAISSVPAENKNPSQSTDDLSRSDSISSASTTVTPLSQGSSTATDTSSVSSVTPSSSSSSSVSSSTSATSSATPTPTPVPVQATSADDGTYYTTITSQSTSATPSIQAAPASGNNSFLQNKALSGVVFAVVGVVALVLLIAIATLALRRSRRKRLHDEAVNFDPTFLGGGQIDRGSVEKRRFSLLSSDNGHSGGVGDFGGYTPAIPAAAAYPRQDPYRYPASESRHNLIAQSQQPWYGGAANGSYGATHVLPSEPRPAWMYGNDANGIPPSKSPIPSDRAKSPESATYLQASDLKITNA